MTSESPGALYLGLDVGTQGTKALLYDNDTHTVVAIGSSSYGLIPSDVPARAEQHPDTWLEGIRQATAQALAQVPGAGRRVKGLAVSGQQHGMVCLDAHGKVLRPAKLWCDTESAAEARELSDAFGWTLVPSFTVTKLLWLKRHEPHVFDATRTVLLPHDYVNLWLTGRAAMECGDASGTGLLDLATRQWDVGAMDRVDPRLRDMFPPLLGPDQAVGSLLPEVAKQLRLTAGIPVGPGSGDNAMSALGAGAISDGSVVMSLGTSGTVFARSPTHLPDPSGVIAPFCDATGAYLPLLCTLNCTRVLEEVREMFGLDHEQLTRLAEAEPPGCCGLTYLPYLMGERTPCWPHASGALLGLRPGLMRPGLLYRAAMEGATLALLSGFRRMVGAGLAPAAEGLRLVGGGARNSLWRRMAADAFQMAVLLPAEAESAALGAALQAAAVVQGVSVAEYVRAHPPPLQGLVVHPEPWVAAAYQEALERFERLGAKLFGGEQGPGPGSNASGTRQ